MHGNHNSYLLPFRGTYGPSRLQPFHTAYLNAGKEAVLYAKAPLLRRNNKGAPTDHAGTPSTWDHPLVVTLVFQGSLVRKYKGY